ncbi:MAG: AAA family ATPase [Candidatus Nanoarchaeia archaeon]|jgi:cell division control protein 6
MGGLFKDILMDNETLFKDETILDYKFQPEEMPERDNEIKEIASFIKPLLQNRLGSNVFIHGMPGLGKTASIKYIFNELKETSDIVPVFINCWESQTTHTIALEIARRLGMLYPPKGVPTEEILNNAMRKLREKGAVVCLDEVDKIKDLDIIYSLLNLERVCILMVTNNPKYKNYIEPRLMSRLNLNNMEFKPYTTREMKNIIERRAKQAFHPSVVSEGVVHEVSINSGTDVRKAINLLLEAGRRAERDASRKITVKHVEEAIKTITINLPQELSDHEEKIINIIKENPNIISGDAYKNYREIHGELSIRSFRRYINRLRKQGLIKATDTGEGFQGRSRKLEVINGF